MAITVKSGYWNDSYSFIKGKSPLTRKLKQLMRKRSLATVQTLSAALTGAAVGGSALKTYKWVDGNGATAGVPTTVGGLGGARTITTRTLINRVTVAADETYQDTLFSRKFGPLTYPGDRSGNGK
jgi:hypothetical protein